jgi:hypothetical protein
MEIMAAADYDTSVPPRRPGKNRAMQSFSSFAGSFPSLQHGERGVRFLDKALRLEGEVPMGTQRA